MVSACTGMSHLTILKSMASRISRLRSLRGAQLRSLSNEDTLVKTTVILDNKSGSSSLDAFKDVDVLN